MLCGKRVTRLRRKLCKKKWRRVWLRFRLSDGSRLEHAPLAGLLSPGLP